MKNIMKIRLVALGLLLAMTVASIGPALANPTAFTDVPVGFWAYEQINRCVQDGIVSGYSDGTFKPGNPVSYGAFSIMLARAFYPNELAGYSDQGTATGEAIMNKHGILSGTSRSSASIGASLPREDMAQVMYNILVDKGAKIPTDTEYLQSMGSISDFQSINNNCRRAVMVCYATGLLGGQSDGSFGPKNPMNRAQGCVVINRLRDYMGNTTEPPVDPVDPSEPPEVTELPAFKLQDGENVQQMMNRLNMATPTFSEGHLSNGKGVTETNIQEMLGSIKQSMPEGTPWATGEFYYYTTTKVQPGGACLSFACGISDYIFGEDAPVYRHQNFDQLKVGDVVWLKNPKTGYDHAVVITSLTPPPGSASYKCTVCSGNAGGKVSWDDEMSRRISENFDMAPYTWIYSRY